MSTLSGVLPEYGLSEYDLTPSTGAPGVVALFLCGVFQALPKRKNNHEASSCIKTAWKIHGFFFFLKRKVSRVFFFFLFLNKEIKFR